MIPDGFGDPIPGFENPYRQAGPKTSYLTIGHTPSSFGGSSSRPALAFPSHDDSFGERNTVSLFYTCHIKLHPPTFLAYPFLTNHLLYESLLPLARFWRL